MIVNIDEYCGACSYFKIGEWNAEKGLFDYYCDVLDKDVSAFGYACPDFKRRVETTEETNCNMVKKSLNVAIDVVDEYIKFWSDECVQEFYYDVSPLEVLEELKTTLITGEYPTKMVE